MKLQLLILLLLIPVVQASMQVDITLSKNDIVREDFVINIDSEDYYDSFEFISVTQPLTVIYEGEYDIVNGDFYTIIFSKNIDPGLNTLEFSVVYDNLIDIFSNKRSFRTGLTGDGLIDVTVILPQNYILREPSGSPAADEISTDGQRIKLEWQFTDEAAISVFYEGPGSNIIPIIIVILFACLFIIAFYVYTHKKTTKKINHMLSENEKLVIIELKKGVTKQKDIAKNLNFSKSRMSKVVRKLEEKNLIKKTPYFKTNKLKLI